MNRQVLSAREITLALPTLSPADQTMLRKLFELQRGSRAKDDGWVPAKDFGATHANSGPRNQLKDLAERGLVEVGQRGFNGQRYRLPNGVEFPAESKSKKEDYCPFVAQACARDIFESLGDENNVQLKVDNILLVVDSSEWKFILDSLLRYVIATNKPLVDLLVVTGPLWLLDPRKEFPQQEIFDACNDRETGVARLNQCITSMEKKVYDF